MKVNNKIKVTQNIKLVKEKDISNRFSIFREDEVGERVEERKENDEDSTS